MSDPNDTIPFGFCHCGCGQKTPIARWSDKRSGVGKGEPYRFVHGHGRGKRDPNLYEVDPITGCWVWNRRPNSDLGYARIEIGGRRVMAHVHMYEKLIGPVPVGLTLDHTCFNTLCINPDHLEPVTMAENVRRKRSNKLNPDRVRAIRAQINDGRNRTEIAQEYGVCDSLIDHIATRRLWKDVS